MEKYFMKLENQIKNLLRQKFEAKRALAILRYFVSSTQKFEEGDWEISLSKAGKFIEAVIKMLWVYSGKSLPPRQKDFKAGVYAQKIIDQVRTTEISEDGVRLEIPRASIFIYDITSNRGARHDSDEITPNEMDASTILPMSSWILAELIRFVTKSSIDIKEAKKIIDSLAERKYPFFEKIGERVYVDHKKFKSATECSLLVLYKVYPKRITRGELTDCLKRHDFKQSAIKLERLSKYIDIDEYGNILLRATGRQKAKEILNKR